MSLSHSISLSLFLFSFWTRVSPISFSQRFPIKYPLCPPVWVERLGKGHIAQYARFSFAIQFDQHFSILSRLNRLPIKEPPPCRAVGPWGGGRRRGGGGGGGGGWHPTRGRWPQSFGFYQKPWPLWERRCAVASGGAMVATAGGAAEAARNYPLFHRWNQLSLLDQLKLRGSTRHLAGKQIR